MDSALNADELSKHFQEVVRSELNKFAEEGLHNKLSNFVDIVVGRLASIKKVGVEPVDAVLPFMSPVSCGTTLESQSSHLVSLASRPAPPRIKKPEDCIPEDRVSRNISTDIRAERPDWSKRHYRTFTMKVENDENYDQFVKLKKAADRRKILNYEPDTPDKPKLDVSRGNMGSGEISIVPASLAGNSKSKASKLEEVAFHPSQRKHFLGDTAEDALRLNMTGGNETADVDVQQNMSYIFAVRIVSHPWFEKSVSIAILFNAVYIGLATDYMARNGLTEQSLSMEIVEFLFLALFVSEILIRLYVFKLDIYRRRLASGRPNLGFHQNVIDTTVIGLQLIEKIFYYGRLHQISILSQMSVLRLLRLLKILRLVRVLRTLRSVQDLRMIVNSIWRSFSLFCWSLLALWFLTFLWSVYLTDLVRDDLIQRRNEGLQLALAPQNEAPQNKLEDYSGSVTRTMITLLWTITGGDDWRYVFEALTSMEHSVLAWVPLLFYIFFASLAMMNVITGVFLETAVEKARQEKEIFLVRNARMIFAHADADKTGLISWTEFQHALSHSDVSNFFESIDIDVAEARSLFELLDLTGDGKISADEFLNGCLRVRGPAKSLDLLVVSREIERLFDMFLTSTNELQQTLSSNLVRTESDYTLQ